MSNLGVSELPRFYGFDRFHFMKPVGPHMPITDGYVTVPPALTIRVQKKDGTHDVWTLGFDYDEREWRTGKWEYDIVLNGNKTGEFGRVIQWQGNKLKIWGADGWRTWTGRQFV